MSEEQPSGGPERPEGRLPRGPVGQSSGSNPEGPKPFWRRTPFLVSAPPLALIMIIAVVGCVSSSSTSSPTASFSASAQASASGSPSPSPSASASGPPSPSYSPSSSSPPPPPPSTSAAPPPTSASGAWCTATASVYYARDDENNVYVHSNQPYTDATASGGGYSWSYETNGSGYAVIYLNGPPAGTPITVMVGAATCTATWT
jgi:hypothetical protein